MDFQEYKYFDTAVNGWQNRNNVQEQLVTTPDMVNTGATYFRYPVEYYENWVSTRSVSGYTGSVYADYLPLDLDRSDLEEATRIAIEFHYWFETQYDVPAGTLPTWFSGSKGYHIEIPRSMFGQMEPSVDLPKYFKSIVTSEWSDWDFDIKIYDKSRLWRYENTINSKTKLYKIRIPNILSMSTNDILELAKSPGQESDISEMEEYDTVPGLECSYKEAKNTVNAPSKKTLVSSRPDWRALLAQPVQKGNRNNTAFDIARSMKYDKHAATNVYDTLVQWNNKNIDPLGLDEIDSIVKSTFKDIELDLLGDADIELPTHPRTDAGNAEQFAELYEDSIRFNHTQKKWFIYTGQFWQKDSREEVFQLCKDAARARQRIAADLPTLEEREKEFSWGISSESAMRIKNTLALAKSMPKITTENDDWHQNKMLLQFDNGTLDLSTQEFREGLPEDMIYQSVGYDYDPFAECPVWEKAISEIFDSSDEMVSFFQRTLGYSLTGDTREHCLFILNGNGSNGKSVVLETIKKAMGNYAENSSFSAFEATNSTQTNDIARLRYARLVTASESGQSKSLNEERIKSITGGDEVTARKLYQEFETWTPQFKIWFAVNTLPEIKGTDDGIWRRIKVIPFNVSFKGREDKDLTQKLSNEIPGILNWAVTGLKDWLELGLDSPDEIMHATDAYRSESDVIANFMEERVDQVVGERVSSKALYYAYREFCNGAGLSPASQTIFGRQMSQMGIPKIKSTGSIFYQDIQIRREAAPDNYEPDLF